MSDAASGTARPALKMILGSLMRADFTVLAKSSQSLVVSIALPVIVLVITNTPRGQARFGGAAIAIALAITYGVFSSSLLGYALTVAQDRELGVFQRLRVTPAPGWAIMVSRLSVQVAANLIISIVVLIVGSIMHGLSLGVGQYAVVLALSVVAGAVFLSLGQALVGLIKSASTVNAVGRVLYIALVLLGLLGMAGTLGSTLKDFSLWSPVGAVMTVLSAGMNDLSSWNSQDNFSLLSCMGYAVVFTIIGVRWFRWTAR